MQVNSDFHHHIRKALNHLYNPEQLRQSALIQWLGLSERADAPSALQHTLIDAIQALRPVPYAPVYSDARKTYEILLLRYIQQFNQPEVAHHIGVSERQLRREQNRAIAILAESLWKKYVPKQPAPAVGTAGAAGPGTPDDPPAEWNWIKTAYSERVSNLPAFIRAILQLIEPVANQHQAALQSTIPDHIPDLAVHPVALRQILLNVLRVAIAHANQGQVRLDATLLASQLALAVSGEAPKNDPTLPDATVFDPQDNLLDIAARLAELSHAQLTLQSSAQGFRAELRLPVVEGVAVLVVDDNRDVIELLRRYTTDTRYHLTGIDDPEGVFAAIESSGARLVILDVMMPKIDGWELLGRLRQHPDTRQIPVIILSILAQEELALSLGASALLTKPVTQERFLEVLDQVYALLD